MLTAAESTSIKIAGLKITSRESYFKLLQEALWKNYVQARKVEPDLPNLSEDEIMLRALEIEYAVFSATTVITIYRRKMALLTSEIKKETVKFNLYVHAPEAAVAVSGASSDLDTENSSSSFVKASEMMLATPAVAEDKPIKLEVVQDSSVQTPASPVGSSLFGKKRVSRLVASENGIVPFSTLPPPPKPASSESDLIARAKEVEARLSTQLSFMSKSTGADLIVKQPDSTSGLDRSNKSRNGSGKESPKTSSKRTSYKSSKRSLESQTSLDRFFTSKKQRLESQPDNSEIDTSATATETEKPTIQPTTETTTKEKHSHRHEKPIKLEPGVTPSKTEKPKSSSGGSSSRSDEKMKPSSKDDQQISSSLTPVKKVEKPKSSSSSSAEKSKSSSSSAEKSKSSSSSAEKSRGSSASSEKPKSSSGSAEKPKSGSGSAEKKKGTSSPDKSKQDIANLVIRCLMPHYAEKKISSRDLFKALARHLSHVIRSLTPPLTSETDVKEFIEKFFQERGGKINSEEDFK